MKFARYGLIAILLSIFFLPPSALAVPLSDLVDITTGLPIPGATISVGDKLFSNFFASLSSFGNAFPNSGDDLRFIDVSGITVDDRRHGLGVRGDFFAEAMSPLQDAQARLDLVFDVTPGDPNVHVRLFRLTPVGIMLTSGSAGVGLGALIPHDDSVRVDTSIQVSSDGLGFAQIEGFDLLFSQDLPEPSTALFLVFGAGVIAAIAHKIR